jgi:hypothetical protein
VEAWEPLGALRAVAVFSLVFCLFLPLTLHVSLLLSLCFCCFAIHSSLPLIIIIVAATIIIIVVILIVIIVVIVIAMIVIIDIIIVASSQALCLFYDSCGHVGRIWLVLC